MAVTELRQVPALLRGEAESAAVWTETCDAPRVAMWLAVTIGGSAAFGAAMGWWRAPEQALYTAVKFPLVILLTALGNAVLNAMLAPLLGVNIGLRQSLLAVLMSFTIAAAILGAASPLLAFVVWNTPPLAERASAGGAHAFLLLTIVVIIAFAGVAANLRLLQMLRRLGGGAGAARRVLFAWLAGNLFLGSQLSWMLRPFIGSPGLSVQFLRDDPLKGSFYEAVFHAIRRLFLD
ncbi:MAG: hypothetical protein HZA89_13865 [Verrucomicrobia bacterium]|nr:hypothetical protein [Verrucomicrobiota bacterium]